MLNAPFAQPAQKPRNNLYPPPQHVLVDNDKRAVPQVRLRRLKDGVNTV